MTLLSGDLPTDDGSMTRGALLAVTKPKQLLKWLRKEGRWPVVAYFSGIAAGALWIYSGMPMICH